MPSPMRFLICLAACSALIACGEDDAAAPKSEVPQGPKAGLAWVRAAEGLDDPAELDRRLAKYPVDKPKFRTAQETQVVLTWRLQRALGDGRIEDAQAPLDALGEHFGGEGRTPTGRKLSRAALHAGLVEALLDSARARIEGPDPDMKGAERALALAAKVSPDADVLERLKAMRAWVELPGRFKLQAHLADHEGARVVVAADDFALGEAILPQVLGRWQRDLGPLGLRVSVVPTLTGEVRVGIRRLQAQDRSAELDAIRNRVIAYGVRIEEPLAPKLRAALGLEPGRCALIVLNRMGDVVARMSGPTIDPRALETVVQRVASR